MIPFDGVWREDSQHNFLSLNRFILELKGKIFSQRGSTALNWYSNQVGVFLNFAGNAHVDVLVTN